jgi:LacI family transcriptional regulator
MSTPIENRPPGRPTMRDVAREAGLSLKTVSRVVNGEPTVGAANAERVNDAIRRLAFRRNDLARNLRRGRSTAAVGVVIEDLANPFYSALTREVEKVARRHESMVLIGSSDEDPERERELVEELCARRVDGLVIVPAANDHRYLRPELSAGVQAVFVDRPAGRIAADAVLLDNAGGARRGVEHLIAGGHRRIGFVGDATSIRTAAERLRGYREALEAHGLPVDPALVRLGSHDAEHAESSTAELVDIDDPPTAFFTTNNRNTLGVLQALRRRGEMRALVGFDDFELAGLLDPPVTVIAYDTAELGRRAAELLFARLEGDRTRVRRVLVETRLLPRGSGELPP